MRTSNKPDFGFVNTNVLKKMEDSFFNFIDRYNKETLSIDVEDLTRAFEFNKKQWKNNLANVDIEEFSANYVFSRYMDCSKLEKETLFHQAKKYFKKLNV